MEAKASEMEGPSRYSSATPHYINQGTETPTGEACLRSQLTGGQATP